MQRNNDNQDTPKDNLQRALRKLRQTQSDVERKIINVEVKIRLLDYTYPAASATNIYTSPEESESDNIDDFATKTKEPSSSNTNTSDSDNDSTNSSLPGTNVKRGDVLRIVNPGPNKESEATVIGLTSGGNIKLQTPDGKTTYRQPHNLLIEVEESGSSSDSDNDNNTANNNNATSNTTQPKTTPNNTNTNTSNKSDNDEPPTDYILTGCRIKLGSIVQVVNPNANQENQGIVIGTTPGGAIRVQTENGDTLNRAPDNLIILNDA